MRRTVLSIASLVLIIPWSVAQTPKPAEASRTLAEEFPVVLRERVEAGKTPVGTKVQANLISATMVRGTVVPRNALFSGEVTQSRAKSEQAPSLLAIRMHTLQWHEHTIQLETDLTAWIYPVANPSSRELSYEPPDASNSPRTWNGGGAYPDPNNPVSQHKFPGREKSDQGMEASAPASQIAKSRVPMPNVIAQAMPGGGVALVSSKGNIKLDKSTTYVLAGGLPEATPAETGAPKQ